MTNLTGSTRYWIQTKMSLYNTSCVGAIQLVAGQNRLFPKIISFKFSLAGAIALAKEDYCLPYRFAKFVSIRGSL